MPQTLEDTPAFEHHPGRNGIADYREGRLVGYRWYDTAGHIPLFAFGSGLGYATVQITGAHLIDPFNIQVTVANTSDRGGFQVIQAYAHGERDDTNAPDQPDQCLVGFVKVAVAAHTAAMFVVSLDPRTYHTWEPSLHDWAQRPGPFEIRVGTNSRAIDTILTVSNPN
jgi:beta-glucosidase